MKQRLAFIVAFVAIAFSNVTAQSKYQVPQNNRVTYNLNYDWKFIKQNVANAQTVAFNDAAWETVSLPHTFNDIDHFDTFITGSGDYGWAGKTWYRKRFKLDTSMSGRKVMVEFEGIRQAAEFYINGEKVGLHENGISPTGIDISNFVKFGNEENVLAVMVDATLGYKEVASGFNFVWNTPPFFPVYGGIVNDVRLHVMDKIYQTLPLYDIMKTVGPYVYAKNFDFTAKTAEIVIETEVKNAYNENKTVDFTLTVVDANGSEVGKKTVTGNAFTAGQTKVLTTSVNLTDVKFWSPDYPNMYTVYSQLSVGGTAVDVYEIPFGVRKVEFDAAKGLTINGRFLYLDGYAPRTTMEWVTVGMPPDWMGEYDFKMMKENNANFIRPMHVTPRGRDVRAADKFGVIYACPAGDAEGDPNEATEEGRRHWQQRVEAMRNAVIYFRNNPSVIFWEGGNQNIILQHMQDIQKVRLDFDPHGGRFAGTRSNNESLLPYLEYGSTMDGVGESGAIPLWDAEYARAECPRRVWDKYTPPYVGGYRTVADPSNNIVEYPTDDFKLNSSEDLAMNNVKKYYDRWSRRGGQGRPKIMVGGAKIMFADGVSHGRMEKTELARVTGAIDGARLPKQAYHALTAAHSDSASIHLVGHWNYPAGTKKKVYVVSNLDEVTLATYNAQGALVNNYGKGVRANNFEFSFADVTWHAGKIVATGYKNGVAVKSMEIVSAGEPAKLKLTPVLGPDGFFADGNDIVMFDVEVVDANGVRCPTEERRVDFTYSGQGKYLGGYNSGIEYSIFKDNLNVECGINRVFVRATRTAGDFTLNVTSQGLTSASATVTSMPFVVTDGLTLQKPQVYNVKVGEAPIQAEFRFQSVNDAEMNVQVTSAITTVMGITGNKTIKISGQSTGAAGAYSINGGDFVTTEGTVKEGDQLRVRLTTDSQYQTTRFVKIEIDGIEEMFSVTTKKALPASTMPNLALNKPTKDVSSAEAGNPINRVNDGLTNTRWAATSGGFPQYFTVDLEEVFDVARVEIVPEAGRAYKYTVEGSLNGTDFFTLTDQSDNTIGGSLIFVDFEPQSARYLKVTVTGGGWVSFYEFRAFEEPKNKPNPFEIEPQTGLPLFGSATSEPFTVTGLGEGLEAEISLSEATETASYTINGGEDIPNHQTSMVKNGDVIRVRLGTGSQYNTTYRVKVTIGGVFAYFEVTTGDPNRINWVNIEKGLIIYPNPTDGVLYVRSAYSENALVEIYSLSGMLVKKENLTSGAGQIDLSGITSGMYLVKYINNTQVLYEQIIKK